ncbi:3-deoxy-7-phosphoheptulonate synthase [Vallitalea sp.]|uniref:3-deoxy-7-phosphoheptulonate synthase n=1 Tax=Vallitalea sp. TaxID=1882829 RepID=UPI002ED2E98D
MGGIIIIVLESQTKDKDVNKLLEILDHKNVQAHEVNGLDSKVLILSGDTHKIDPYSIESIDIVKKYIEIKDPYKRANRLFHSEDSVYNIKGKTIGGKNIALIAGPCSVESQQQIEDIARIVKRDGASFLRGGAFKPRTSPYTFQGLGTAGLEYLKEASKKTGLPIVTEIMSADYIDQFVECADIIQVGARNMQNYALLKELGKIHKPILLKRGLSATIEEFLLSAEYIMANGNNKVILCERGIRTFETYTRNTLDLSAVVAIKRLSHLPIIVDPSHACGRDWMVSSLSKAAIAVGADGLIIEVCEDPENAVSDGKQTLTPFCYKKLVKELRVLAKAVGRDIA